MANKTVVVLDITRFREALAGDTVVDGTGTPLGGGGGGAPVGAEYITSSSDPTLTAERVATDTSSITWDFGTAAQAKAKRAALIGDVTAAADSNATTIAANAVDNTKLRDSAGTSVIGKASAGAGDPADITASADEQVLIRQAGVLLFATLSESDITNLVADLAAKAALVHTHAASDIVSGVLPEARGGTNQGSYAQGDLLYASATNTLSRLPVGIDGAILTANGITGLPEWRSAVTGWAFDTDWPSLGALFSDEPRWKQQGWS